MNRSAAVVLVRDDGRVLLQHRDNRAGIAYPDHWGIPGGKVEKGESPEKAARRELEEETGYRADFLNHLVSGAYRLPKGSGVSRLPKGKFINRHIFWSRYDGRQKIECREGKEMKFISPAQFRKLKIYPDHERFSRKVSDIVIHLHQKNKYKAIVFDYGGVIIPVHMPEIKKDIIQAFKISTEKAKEAFAVFNIKLRTGRIDEKEYWKRFSEFVEKPLPRNVYQLWTKSFDYRSSDKMRNFLEKLNNLGYKTAVLSNVNPPHAEKIDSVSGYDFFQYRFLSYEVGLAKPDPRFYKYALKKMYVKPGQTIFIEDTLNNLTVAKKLGLKTVLATSENQVIREISGILRG